MKKKLSIALVLTFVVMTLTACGSFTCNLCGEEKTGKSHKSELLGQEFVICDDCHKSINNIFGGN